MKHLITALITIAAITSCQKPNADDRIDPNKKYTRTLNFSDQVVKTSVDGSTLHMDYYERASLLIDPGVYKKTWALHLKEGFAGTQLAPYHFTSVTEDNTTAFDWVADNLNNVSRKTVTDTSVDGQKFKKVSVDRVLNFVGNFSNQQQALDMQNKLLQTQTDYITFSSYYYSNGVTSLADSASAKLTYIK
jgi:hypothetical protein